MKELILISVLLFNSHIYCAEENPFYSTQPEMINQEPAISPFKELVAIHKELKNLRLRIEKAGPFNSSKKNHLQIAREIHNTSIPDHIKDFFKFMNDKK